jgi:hypothetical protein
MKKRLVVFIILVIVAVVSACIIKICKPRPYKDSPLGV